MHVVKQVVQHSSGSGRSFFIGFGQNQNPQKSKIPPELTSRFLLFNIFWHLAMDACNKFLVYK